MINEAAKSGGVARGGEIEEILSELRLLARDLVGSSKGSFDAIRARAVERLEREWAEVKEGGPRLVQVWWRFLPPPTSTGFDLGPALLELQRARPHQRIDQTRVDFALSLKPSEIAVGSESFAGYLAFLFKHTRRVLMDCPFEGNAAYVFHSDWSALSRLPKHELLEKHAAKVDRVIHSDSGNWMRELRLLLK